MASRDPGDPPELLQMEMVVLTAPAPLSSSPKTIWSTKSRVVEAPVEKPWAIQAELVIRVDVLRIASDPSLPKFPNTTCEARAEPVKRQRPTAMAKSERVRRLISWVCSEDVEKKVTSASETYLYLTL